MAKQLNNNVPFVNCKIMNESISSDVLSDSYANFSTDFVESPKKAVPPNVGNASIENKHTFKTPRKSRSFIGNKSNDFETARKSTSPASNKEKEIESSTSGIPVSSKNNGSNSSKIAIDIDSSTHETTENLSSFLRNTKLNASIFDISSMEIIECPNNDDVTIKTTDNTITSTPKSDLKVDKEISNTEDVPIDNDPLHFRVFIDEVEKEDNVNSNRITIESPIVTKTIIDQRKELDNNTDSDESDDGNKSDKDSDYNVMDDFEAYDEENSNHSDEEFNDQVLSTKNLSADDNITIRGKIQNQKEVNTDKVTKKQVNSINTKERVIRTTRQRKIYASVAPNDQLKIDEKGNIDLLSKNLNVPGTPTINTKDRYVSRIKKSPTNKKKKQRKPKKHCCYFCGSLISDQIRRHIMSVHKEENVMIDAARLGKTEMHNAVTNLINLGDYNYNYSSSVSSEKEMLVARRPNSRQVIKPKVDSESGELIWPKNILNTKNSCTIVSGTSDDGKAGLPKIYNYDLPETETGDQYVPCKECLKTVKRSLLSKHKCIKKKMLPNTKGIVNECDNLIPNTHPLASQRLRDLVFKTMRSGYIKDIVKRDESIVLFGNAAVSYYNNDQDYQMISHQLRLLAEILWHAQSKNSEIKIFEDLLHRDNLELVEDSMKVLVEYDEVTATLDKSHKTKEMTTLLKKVVDFFVSRNSRMRQDDKAKEIKKFWDSLKGEVKVLNKKSRECYLKNEKKKKPKIVPKVDDINKLAAYAEEVRSKAYDILCKKWDPDAYADLNKATLILLLIFNRKRQGELSRLLVEDLQETSIYKLNDVCNGDEYTSLSEESQEAAKDYYRVSIMNKKGLMNVGLIIHKRLLDSINLIIQNRHHEKFIHPKNKYVFAKASNNSSIDHYYKAYQVIKDYSTLCGASNPKTLRGTLLRKQVATMMYGINVDDGKLKDLARFLGHDYEIHKNYYRQQIPVRELINITPLLEKAQGINPVNVNINNKNSSTEKTLNKNDSITSEYQPNSSLEDEFNELDKSLSQHDSEDSSDINFFEAQKKLREEKKKPKSKKRRHLDSDSENIAPQKKKICRRIAWTDEEKAAVAAYVAEHGLPSTVSAEYLDDMMKAYPILEVNRNQMKIRAYMSNNKMT